MVKFMIEQVAIAPLNQIAAKKLLADLGIDFPVHDEVRAEGEVYSAPSYNVAELDFNYDTLEKANELELLYYKEGDNWIDEQQPCVSHFGMHVTYEQLKEFDKVFKAHEIEVAQEVKTTHHTNPSIAGIRWYHYVIYETYPILGVDLKFIIRLPQPEEKVEIADEPVDFPSWHSPSQIG